LVRASRPVARTSDVAGSAAAAPSSSARAIARSLRRLAIAVLTGATITLAIAIAIAVIPIGRTYDYGDPSSRDLRLWSRVVPPDFPLEPTHTTVAVVGQGYRTRTLVTDVPRPPGTLTPPTTNRPQAASTTGPVATLHIYYLVQAGWPFPCLEGTVIQDGINPPRSWMMLADGHHTRYVPLRPIAHAFAANTAIFASVLLVGWIGCNRIVRWRRIRRGCCLECGHRLDVASICPECGTARL